MNAITRRLNPTLNRDLVLRRTVQLIVLVAVIWGLYEKTRTTVEAVVAVGLFYLWLNRRVEAKIMAHRLKRKSDEFETRLAEEAAKLDARAAERVDEIMTKAEDMVAAADRRTAEAEEAREIAASEIDKADAKAAKVHAEAAIRVMAADDKAREAEEKLAVTEAWATETVARLDLSGQFVAACLCWAKALKSKRAPAKASGVVLDDTYWWGRIEAIAAVRWSGQKWEKYELQAAVEEIASKFDLLRWRQVCNSEFGLTLKV